jgi:hypothetical protein
MTLVSSGTIGIKNATNTRSIEYEIQGNKTGTQAFTGLSNTADPSVGSLPTSFSDFYSHTQIKIPLIVTGIVAQQDNFDCTPLDISCTWNNLSPAPTAYRIEYRIATGSWNFIANDTSSGWAGSFTNGVQDSDWISVRIRGYNGAGNGPFGYDNNAFTAYCAANEK